MKVIVVGSTGLCGASFLKLALESSAVDSVWSFSRRAPNVPDSDKLKKIVSKETSEWPSSFPQSADIMFSGIATTRAAAGSLEKQRTIDHDLQVQLAKEAQAKGCKTFILVSAAMANSSSMIAYSKMKGETEEAIIDLGFDKTIILRPGPLMGERESKSSGFGASFIESVMPWFHRSFAQSLAKYPVYDYEVTNCALKLAQTLPAGVHFIESKRIIDETNSEHQQK